MARNDTAWFRVTVIFLAVVLFFSLPLAALFVIHNLKLQADLKAIVIEQNRKISKLEKKMPKDDDE
jgi:predicted exporter